MPTSFDRLHRILRDGHLRIFCSADRDMFDERIAADDHPCRMDARIAHRAFQFFGHVDQAAHFGIFLIELF